MNLKAPVPKPGRYIVAVSGGVDSVVLLDWLQHQAPESQLLVAHFNHGLQAQADQTADFVRQLADSYRLTSLIEAGSLANSSEAEARLWRYRFLKRCQQQHQATAIITAHHQDDLIETILINLSRGSGRRGLTSLASYDHLIRPFLLITKSDLIDYAQSRNLTWRPDPSNTDLSYLRNRFRAKLAGRVRPDQRRQLIEIYQKLTRINRQLDDSLVHYLSLVSYRRLGTVYSRPWFNRLPDVVAQEIVYWWLLQTSGSYGRSTQVDYLLDRLKKLAPGKKISLNRNQFVYLTKRSIRFPEPVARPVEAFLK